MFADWFNAGCAVKLFKEFLTVKALTAYKLWDTNNGVTLCARCHYDLHKEIRNGRQL